MRLLLGRRTVDLDARRVTGASEAAGLSPAEVLLLRRLASAEGRPVPADELQTLVGAASENAFHRAVVRLRNKLEDDPWSCASTPRPGSRRRPPLGWSDPRCAPSSHRPADEAGATMCRCAPT